MEVLFAKAIYRRSWIEQATTLLNHVATVIAPAMREPVRTSHPIGNVKRE